MNIIRKVNRPRKKANHGDIILLSSIDGSKIIACLFPYLILYLSCYDYN